MGRFNSDFFRVLAVGPAPDPKLVTNLNDCGLESVVAHGRQRSGGWSQEERDLYQESKDLLYAMVMLRAEAFFKATQQGDGRVPDDQKMAEVHLVIRIKTDAADRDANTERSNHKRAAVSATDKGLSVAIHGMDYEDGNVARLIARFEERGLACPR